MGSAHGNNDCSHMKTDVLTALHCTSDTRRNSNEAGPSLWTALNQSPQRQSPARQACRCAVLHPYQPALPRAAPLPTSPCAQWCTSTVWLKCTRTHTLKVHRTNWCRCIGTIWCTSTFSSVVHPLLVLSAPVATCAERCTSALRSAVHPYRTRVQPHGQQMLIRTHTIISWQTPQQISRTTHTEVSWHKPRQISNRTHTVISS